MMRAYFHSEEDAKDDVGDAKADGDLGGQAKETLQEIFSSRVQHNLLFLCLMKRSLR